MQYLNFLQLSPAFLNWVSNPSQDNNVLILVIASCEILEENVSVLQ